jgi:branched-chain amino acid transport system permease protein
MIRERRADLIGVAVFAGACVVFGLAAPVSVVNVGVYAMIYAIAAAGLSLLMGVAGQVSLGHAAFFAIGAYTQAILVTRHEVYGAVAALAAVVLAMLVALLVGLPLLRLRGHYLALATLGLGIIVTVLATESEFTGGTSGIYGIAKPEFNSRTYDSPAEFFWLLTPVVVVAVLLARNVVQSRVGRALRALNDSEPAAETLGVDTFRLRLQVFVLSAGYAGLAGVFYAHWLAVVNPNAANFPLSVKFLLMVVLGGLGSIWGAVVGAFGVEFLDEGLRELIPRILPGAVGEVELIGFGLVLVAVTILRTNTSGISSGQGVHWSHFRRLWTTGQVTAAGHLTALSTGPENVTNERQVRRAWTGRGGRRGSPAVGRCRRRAGVPPRRGLGLRRRLRRSSAGGRGSRRGGRAGRQGRPTRATGPATVGTPCGGPR